MKRINKKIFLKNTKLQIFLGTVVIVLCVMVWPLRLFYHSTYSGYAKTQPSYTGAVTMEDIVLQQFMPKQDHIYEIRVEGLVEDVHSMDRVFVTLYDENLEILYQEILYFTDIQTLGYVRITPELDVTAGNIYYIGLNVHFESEGTLKIAYADQSALQIDECGIFAYANAAYPEQTILIRFQYTQQFSALLILLCITGIIVTGLLLYVGMTCLTEALRRKKMLRKVQKTGLIVLFAGSVLLDFFCFYQLCIARIFGGEIWDLLVYAAACILMLVLSGYACYKGEYRVRLLERRDGRHRHSVKKPDMPAARLWKKTWLNYLQIVCFVFLFWAGVEYVDAPIQWKQDVARNWVFLLFGLIVILTYRLHQVVNLFTVIFSLLMIPAGIVYCYMKGPDAHAVEAARVMVAAADFWGIILIRTIRNLRRIREQKWNLPLAVCWGLMCVFMIFNSYGKLWPILMVVTFTLFYLQDYTERDKDQLIHNMITAILSQFCFMVIMCYLHRPYHYYQFIRYPMWFHTVASTGMYLAMVEAAALLCLFLKMRDTGTVFRKAWKEWLINGVVLAYISLTVARTAIMAVIGLCLTLAIGAAIVYRPRIRTYLRIVGIMVLSLMLSIPVVYTTTRCIPAVVNKPVYLNDAEDFDFAIREGEALDSDSYMYFRALVRLWARRFWVPENFIQTYLEDKVSNNQELLILAELASVRTPELSDTAESSGDPEYSEKLSAANDMSNGRLAIFKDYLEHLSWSGHPKMGYDGDYELMSGHAHNSFLQNAFDFGIPAGILFFLLILGMIVTAVYQIWTGRERSEKQFMLLLTAAAFMLVSLTEYTSNPCMPLCFSTLFMLITMKTEKNVLK